MPKKHWSKERVIAELFRQSHGETVDRPKLRYAARAYFGGMRNALKAAGLPCGNQLSPRTRWSQQSVIESIRKRCREGKELERAFREDLQLYRAAKRLFGNWSTARAAAGFPRPERENYTSDEVQLYIIDLYERGVPLRFHPSVNQKLNRSVKKHFGSWRRAVQSLGLESELKRIWSDQAVIDTILYRRAAGLSLSIGEVRQEDSGLIRAAYSRFGGWHNALETAGIHARVREQWDERKVIDRIRHYVTVAAGQGIYKIDSKLVDAAARRIGSLKNAMKAAGVTTQSRRRR